MGWLQLILFFTVLFLLVKPLGRYMTKVYRGDRTIGSILFGWLECGFYRICGIDYKKSMNWKEYSLSVIVFSLASLILVYLILNLQSHFGQFGLNPLNLPNVSSDLAFNTAASFITNTDWQSYGGETTMSYFSQMVGLTVQNFISAAIGMAVLIAFTRGFANRKNDQIGNFWVDMTRSVIYILLPLSLLLALLLGSQGVVQTMKPYVAAELLEKSNVQSVPTQQIIAVGPTASQVAIKQLGTNGGGFFNVNSAHPLENPNSFTNFLEMLAIVLIPAALCYSFGQMVGNTKQGWILLTAMALILIPLAVLNISFEQKGNPKFNSLNIDQKASDIQAGGNMEGKEVRFGIVNSVLWSDVTTAASNGAVNSMLDSYTPLGGMIPLVLMQLGEVVFGGVGSGLYGMLILVIITVFIAGLMVGRTPEYLGKKINAFEIKMAAVATLIPCLTILVATAIAVMCGAGKVGIFNPHAQGFTEILYAFSSTANNNGSAFAGLSANTPFYNIILGIVMLIGRYGIILPVLAIAGSMATKNTVPESSGTFPTTGWLFVVILIGTIVMISILTFVPALALGPIAEYFN